SFYWTSRLIAALADAHHAETIPAIARYQQKTLALAHAPERGADETAGSADSEKEVPELPAAAHTAIAEQIWAETEQLLGSVLFTASNRMTNRFSRPDGRSEERRVGRA